MISMDQLAREIDIAQEPSLLVLGTGYGLADEMLDRCDVLLEPIRGNDEYNHLSVRAAAAIILDRLHSARSKVTTVGGEAR